VAYFRVLSRKISGETDKHNVHQDKRDPAENRNRDLVNISWNANYMFAKLQH